MVDLYREEILDHYKNPRNFGRLSKPCLEVYETNPLCGDEVTLDLKLIGEPPQTRVEKVSFEAKGCAVSIASSSMLTEKILGKTKKDVEKINEKEVLSWFGGNLTSSRRDCAFLSLKALKKLLES